MPVLPAGRVPVHYGAGTGSAPPTFPAGTARSVVVGNAGGCPPGFRFDGDEPGYRDESVVARIEPDHCTIQTDLSVLYSAVRLQGGAATLLPDGAKITGLACINTAYNSGGPYGWPYQSQHKNAWDDSLCVLCVDAAGGGAGLYYSIWDGALYRWPKTVQAPHLCLAEAHTTTAGLLLVGTPHGVYSRSSNVRDTTSPWQRSGDFARRVTRISVTYLDADHPVYWALVQDTLSGGKVYHGLYRYPAYSGASSSPELEGGWQPVLRSGELVDAVASSADEAWYVAKADPHSVHHLVFNPGAGTVVDTAMALPAGAQGTHLDYVPALGGHGNNAVFCAVAGASSPLYASVDSGGWGAFTDADPGGTLRDPAGTVVGVNSVRSSGLTFLGWVSGALVGSAGQFVQAFCCTTSGLFWTDDLANPWRAVSSASGLDDVSCGDVAAGQWIALLGGPVTPVNRVFVANADRLYTSHSQTNLWSEGAPHTPVTVGPALSALVAQVSGTLPENNLQTIGPGGSSPIGGVSASHLQVSGILPTGWYWLRTLNQYQELQWHLVNGNVTGTDRLVQQQVSDLSADSSARVALLTASGRLAETAVAFLGEHSTPRVDLSVQTTFTTQEAAARLLRASMAVPVRYHGQMLARASDGTALGTVVVDLSAAPFFIKSVTFETDSQMGPGACVCRCELSTTLGDDRSANAIAAALLDSVKNAHKTRRGRR